MCLSVVSGEYSRVEETPVRLNVPMSTDWQEKYRVKRISAEEALEYIKPGDRIFISPGCSEPLVLTKQLVEKSYDLVDTEIVHFLPLRKLNYDKNGSQPFRQRQSRGPMGGPHGRFSGRWDSQSKVGLHTCSSFDDSPYPGSWGRAVRCCFNTPIAP